MTGKRNIPAAVDVTRSFIILVLCGNCCTIQTDKSRIMLRNGRSNFEITILFAICGAIFEGAIAHSACTAWQSIGKLLVGYALGMKKQRRTIEHFHVVPSSLLKS